MAKRRRRGAKRTARQDAQIAQHNNKVYTRALFDGSKEGLENSLVIVQEAAVENAPERTGALKASADIIVRAYRVINVMYGRVMFLVPYAAIVHERINQPGRKYLTRAYQTTIGPVKTAFAEAIRKHLRRANKRFKR